MKISANAWHFKLYCLMRQGWDDDAGPFVVPLILLGKRHLNRRYSPTTLCKYFWSTLLLTLIFPIVLIFISILAAVVIPFIWTFFKIKDDWWNEPTRKKKRDFEKYTKYDETKKEKTPNLLVEFVKAKKSKVCPLIEIVD